MNPELIIPTVSVLAPKRGKVQEILVILFEKCNLKCTFCHQDHNSTVGMDNILDHAARLIATYPRDGKYIINISGGELFLDDIPDEALAHYGELVRMLDEYFYDVAFTFVSNMIFTRVDRVLGLLTDLIGSGIDVTLATSYDPVGRFNGRLKRRFESNVTLFQSLIRVVTTVMTNDTVAWFISGKSDPTFDSLYSKFNLYFDHYTPDKRNCTQIPTDSDIADFYITMANRYPNIQPLKGWLTATGSATTCRKTVVTSPTGEISTCRALPKEDRDVGIISGEVQRVKSEDLFMDQYGCLTCKYYHRCGLRCFLAHEYSPHVEAECHYVRMFDHFEQM